MKKIIYVNYVQDRSNIIRCGVPLIRISNSFIAVLSSVQNDYIRLGVSTKHTLNKINIFMWSNRDITDKLRKYFSGHLVAPNKTRTNRSFEKG